MRSQIFNANISSGASVSGTFSVLGARDIGLLAAIPTSCTAYIQVSHNTTSADFRRAGKIDGSGAWTWSVGSGNAAVQVSDAVGAFPYFRLETSVVQGDVTSLQAVVKL